MNRIIIGVIVFIVILISTYFYLKGSCSQGYFFSKSDFKCIKCKDCPINKWYNPNKSCKGFTDKICLDYSMPECSPGQRTIMGTETSDRSCELLSKCYRDCGEGKYARGEHNCYGLSGRTMTCTNCKVCDVDEIDIAEENCRGRMLSNINGLKTRVIGGEWVPMSCEGIYDRVCLKDSYIKYNQGNDYNIIFHSDDTSVYALNTSRISDFQSEFYYGSTTLPTIINEINRIENWGPLSILELNNQRNNADNFKWKIKSSNLRSIYNNCPIEQNDIIYFYKNLGDMHDIILSVVESGENDNLKYDIGYIKVNKGEHNFSNLTSLRDKIYTDFKIQNFYNFTDNILISNDDSNNRNFKLQLVKIVNNVPEEKNLFLGYEINRNLQNSLFLRILNGNSISNQNTIKINFQKI